MVMTFLPFPDLKRSVQALSNRHLNKQITEAKQIYDAIHRKTGYSKHKAAVMWSDTPAALAHYHNFALEEWYSRSGGGSRIPIECDDDFELPWWFGWEAFHASHRAMLNRKDPFNYHFEVDEEYTHHGYVWPGDIDPDLIEAPLSKLCAPIPDALIDPSYCEAVIKSGKRKGEFCHNLIKDDNEVCRVHKKK